MKKRIVIITGASSGIGLAAVKEFLANGDRVYGLSRRECPEPGAFSIPCDVTDEAAVTAALERIIKAEGRMDVLVCNAGFGISGAVEFTGMSEAKKQFEVNFFGTAVCIKAALPHMREKGRGHIIVTSSVAGSIPIPFQTYYSSTKAAINALVLATANEVRPYGIKICAVLPGDIKTGFTGAREKSSAGEKTYGALKNSVASMEKDEQNGMPPSAIAKRMLSLSKKKNPKPLSTAGLQYKLFLVLAKLLPARLTNWIVGKMYANSK
ncbi:MAG: SDR family oxidoreductase [Clostridia bacterium]|nr:SDR family oxidoreductase [Clostridia bacterium]